MAAGHEFFCILQCAFFILQYAIFFINLCPLPDEQVGVFCPVPGTMAKKIYFITGGARSGKSAHAEQLARSFGGRRAYIATAQALDAEMAARIAKHRKDRGDAWDTYEEPLAVAELLGKLSLRYEVVLLDCLTLWLSNVMAHSDGDGAVLSRSDELVKAIREFGGSLIVVSNEVGLGIVPDNPLARKFRDLAGMLNQKVARTADEVYFTAAGIPVKIK
jgi:adenosylcobinamide kinase/adenosylcobinamide-phosphate guanylyltransferase